MENFKLAVDGDSCVLNITKKATGRGDDYYDIELILSTNSKIEGLPTHLTLTGLHTLNSVLELLGLKKLTAEDEETIMNFVATRNPISNPKNPSLSLSNGSMELSPKRVVVYETAKVSNTMQNDKIEAKNFNEILEKISELNANETNTL